MRSANEISGLVLKAARGAGMPLGYAEELARAAPFLAQAEALDVLSGCLETTFDVPVLDASVLRGGHLVLAAVAYLDLTQTGQRVSCEPAVPAELMQAMMRMRSETAPAGPFDVAEDLWVALQRFAERTFVPETEASRLAGAGAGLSDND